MIVPESAQRLRRRNGWEALDAGVLLWRSNLRYLLPALGLPVALAAVLSRLLPGNLHLFSYLLLWWLKPLFERCALRVVSIRFFEAGAGWGRLLRGLLPFLWKGLPGDLLWRRFSPWRSCRLPVRALEGLKGRLARRRMQALDQGGSSFMALATVLLLCLEAALICGEILFVVLTLKLTRPEMLGGDWKDFLSWEPFIFAIVVFQLLLFEGIYLCMGFCLYINSRVHLEGWDIQLAFKSLRARSAEARPPSSLKALGLLLLALAVAPATARGAETLSSAAETPSSAAETPSSAPQSQTASPVPAGTPLAPGQAASEPPYALLDKVLDTPDFGGGSNGWGIRLRNPKAPPPEQKLDIAPWMELFRRWFAWILRGLLALAILALVAFLVIFAWRRLSSRRPSPGRAVGMPSGGPSPSSPEALLREAERLESLGQIREAWASWLLAAIGAWSSLTGQQFPDDSTEMDCLRLARSMGSPRFEEFSSFIRTWVAFAYAGREPSRGRLVEAIAFCRSLTEAIHA